MVLARQPVAIVTVGDNAYRENAYRENALGGADYASLVGRWYCRYLADAPPSSVCPESGMAPTNRFYPATGNHDYSDVGIQAYQEYFVAARSRTWYSVVIQGVEFLILDTQLALDDPASMAAQRAWLAARARSSTADWQVVVLHHPPYSSSSVHGSTKAFQWPYRTWGIDLVIAGHDHNYERLRRWGVTYIVNGAGGADLYRMGPGIMGSLVGNDQVHGALFLRASQGRLMGEFRATSGEMVDRFTLTQ